MRQATTVQQKSTKASIVVSNIIGKHMMPYSDSDIVKECIIAAARELYPDKPDILQSFSSIPLSRNTCTRRIEDISDQILLQLLTELRQAETFSICLDESTDVKDVAQLAIFVRFFNGQLFREAFLTIIGMQGNATGLAIFEALMQGLKDLKLDPKRIVSVATDGAPAMVGRTHGLIGRMKESYPHLLDFHCIIHQSVLCAKLDNNFKAVMTTSMKLINFLKAKSALRHRQLRAFLESCDSEHKDLLTHNEVRWLSKGNALARLWELQPEILLFLDEHEIGDEYREFLRSAENMSNLVFLVDFFNCMNNLNLEIQGNGKSVLELWVSINSFKAKLSLFSNDVQAEQNFFPSLKGFVQNWDIADNMDDVIEGFQQFIAKVQTEFASRFKQFESIDAIIQFVSKPMNASVNGKWKDQLKELFPEIKAHEVQLELCDIQANGAALELANPVSFWSGHVAAEKYPVATSLARKLLTIFGSTYQCESMFSKLNGIKTKHRSSLNPEHLEQLLRVCCVEATDTVINMVMAEKKTFHISH